MINEFEHLMGVLRLAASRIAPDYFQLPIAAADAVYRERVYCYELYHQMRSAWGPFPFSLAGEIDKSGHPFFRDGPYAHAKPDFLIHSPGDMLRNLACIEVKASSVSMDDLRRDLEKLAWFHSNAQYFAGVQLIYGDAVHPNVLRHRVQDAAQGIELGAVQIFYHARPGDAPEVL